MSLHPGPGTPLRRDFALVSGDTLDVEVPMETTAGAPANLAGWRAETGARGREDGAALTVAAVIVGSSVRLSAAPTETASWPRFVLYDVTLTGPTGLVVTPARGVITVLRTP